MIRLISVSLVLCAPWTLILWDEPDEARADDTAAVDFNRDVRPLLADRCFKCHGPNESDRKAGLRLDVREGAIADHDGLRAIVPGAPEASELVRRITAGDEDRMPPHKEGKRLAAADVELLQRWIEEGAEWKEHWSFVPPEKPALPALRDEEWPLTPIDFFIAAKLDEEGLAPAPEADRETLIRRLTQDLTGLPPTLEEIDAFLEDEGADAYDKVVDRLLASPSFGEHMALTWLDCSRYADTNGYHRDGNRSMWLWRDWLIDAFNRNLPYDRFVVEQLAGDLLPDATVDQKVATGFNRNHMVNDEGGAIAEEYQVEYVVDRVRTTSTVFMGLTMQCAQCHDHKYDPITQEDYYRFYAFLNKVPEKGLDGADANPVPSMSVPRPEDQVKIDAVQERLDAIETRMAAPQPELDAGELVWAEARAREIGERWSTLALEDLEATYGIELEALDDGSVLADGENPDRSDYSFRARTQEQHITALRLEVLTHESFPNQAATRTSHGNWVLSELELEAVSLADPNLRETVRFESAVADYSQQDYEVSKAVDGEKSTGWAVDGHERRECRTAIFVPAEPFGFEGGTELLFKMRHEYGSQHTLGRFRYSIATAANLARDHKASKLGVWHFAGPFPGEPENLFKTDSGPEAEGPDRDLAATYLDGQIAWEPREDLTDGETHTFEGERSAFYLYRTLEAETARSISLSLGSDDSMVMWLNGVRVHDHPDPRSVAADQDRLDLQLVEGANELLIKIVNYGGPAGVYFRVVSEGPPVPAGDLTAALAVPATERTEAHAFAIRDVYRRDHWEEWPSMSAEAEEARAEIEDIRASTPRLSVMVDEPGVRMTYMLERGQYDKPGNEVRAGAPASLPAIPEREDGLEPDRLDLARWLVSGEHPLTARVAVNRLWQTVFGTGLVASAEDFGAQGEWPSHERLLDWLAAELVESGWDTKAMLRAMVRSRTYRQESRVDALALEHDPHNRLLARASRSRLPAESVRDHALMVSGLLTRTIGGPSVKPYQPEGLWAEMTFRNANRAEHDFYKQDTGEDLYRRGMYTFWKRSVPPPNMLALDAPTREICTVRRSTTNTPLQALVLLNDPTFVEAARALAQRALNTPNLDRRGRMALAFRLSTSRHADADELDVLEAFLVEQLESFAHNPESAAELLAVGDSMRDERLDPAEHAAWTTLCSLILNLDESMTHG